MATFSTHITSQFPPLFAASAMRFATKELHDSVLFFRYPISTTIPLNLMRRTTA